MLYEKLVKIVGHDVLQLFGDTGTGKTFFCIGLMREAVKNGKKVVFIDSERNLNFDETEKPENLTYYYSPELKDIINTCANLPKADLYILDSMGFPVVTQFAMASMKEKGDMLLKCVTLTHYLKVATWRNKALAVVTNQPVSPFGKNIPEDQLPPFGDKSQFGYKEIWRTTMERTNENETTCSIRAWRSRKFGRGKILFLMKISSKGVEIKPFI